ncbi:branched-chain amino acid ABC transporter permease [Frankia sp. CcI49]|uniref:branched-chain amino acid ABC transporter permease n=1 Tax=Frankia sp. CcI49 TaxID=1745382 RepID=UPI000976C7C9|nr:branched-chain amino acid ABC transporter permease [Frankia sp. CcI49]ONH60735.1 branched-chain amino acid ABC transporter permease [Frankia sp. CcI49]
MTTFLSLLSNGLAVGAVYALLALGFVIIFRCSEVLNFAHGAVVLLGAYVIARTHEALGFTAAVALGIAAAAGMSALIERVLVRRLRNAPTISLTIMLLGVDILIATDLTRRIGSDILGLGHPWGADVVEAAEVSISANRLIAFAVAAVVIAGLFTAFRLTSWGVAMRAAAEDPEAAQLMGIRLGRVALASWLLGGALAAVAGIFLTGSPTPGLEPGIRWVAFAAFPVAVLGGLDSPGGALVAGLLIGVSESLAAGYQDDLLFLGRGIGEVVPYFVMIVVLLVRPTGLAGTKELNRV